MTQFGLFDAPLALVDGERGRVTYYDRFVPAEESEAAFAAASPAHGRGEKPASRGLKVARAARR
jgi:hypothetical protein